MKRYRLKKDLPAFKAGDVFEINEYGNLIHCYPLWNGWDLTTDCESTLEKSPNILKDCFEEIPEEPKTVWDLKEGDKCYVLNTEGMILERIWGSVIGLKSCRAYGNLFLAKEEAEKELARRKAKVILERDTKEFKPDWSNKDQNKTLVYYDSINKKMRVIPCSVNAFGEIYFATREDAEGSIKNHEKEVAVIGHVFSNPELLEREQLWDY